MSPSLIRISSKIRNNRVYTYYLRLKNATRRCHSKTNCLYVPEEKRCLVYPSVGMFNVQPPARLRSSCGTRQVQRVHKSTSLLLFLFTHNICSFPPRPQPPLAIHNGWRYAGLASSGPSWPTPRRDRSPRTRPYLSESLRSLPLSSRVCQRPPRRLRPEYRGL